MIIFIDACAGRAERDELMVKYKFSLLIINAYLDELQPYRGSCGKYCDDEYGGLFKLVGISDRASSPIIINWSRRSCGSHINNNPPPRNSVAEFSKGGGNSLLALPYGAVCQPHKEEINTFRNLCFNCNSVYFYPDAHSAIYPPQHNPTSALLALQY